MSSIDRNPLPSGMGKFKWYPQFTGLVKDPEGKHYKKMGMAKWLFDFFCADADRKSGEWRGCLSGVAEDTGIPIWTVKRHMRVLKKGGYVETQRHAKGIIVKIKKYKTIVRPEGGTPSIGDISSDERTPLERNPKSRLYIAGTAELQEYFCGVLGKTCLAHLDTYTLQQMYWDKVPLVVIKGAVEEVMSRTKKREIFTVRYFKKAIYEGHRKYTHRLEPERELMSEKETDKKKKFHDMVGGMAKENQYGEEEGEEII